MSVSYELRTVRSNSPVYVFDDIVRAKQAQKQASEKKIPLALVKVTRVEEPIS